MQNLLEEIYLQHLKKLEGLDFIDRGIASIEGFFGQGAKAGEERELHSLFGKAKRIVDFPKEYEVMPSTKTRGVDSQARSIDTSGADRTSSGCLSESGRQRLISGITKCNPQDIGYAGDKMLARAQSYEIAVLVPLLVGASTFVNTRLGIQTDEYEGFDQKNSMLPKRFNFRFLADYRNIVFICFVSCWWQLRRS
jgi:hypothetical protein